MTRQKRINKIIELLFEINAGYKTPSDKSASISIHGYTSGKNLVSVYLKPSDDKTGTVEICDIDMGDEYDKLLKKMEAFNGN